MEQPFMTLPDPRDVWAREREIVLSRVLAAARERVFEAWSRTRHLGRWFGPEGFTVETLESNIQPGGRWRFIYVGPDGTRYDNRIVYHEVNAPGLLVFDHGPDLDDAPERFRVTVSLDAQDDGKTVVTLRQLHPTKEQRDATIGFGAVELGYQTLDKLERYVVGEA